MAFRPQDTEILDTINVNSDTWQTAFEKINQIVDHLRNVVVTTSNTSAYVGNTSGNAFVTGIFGSNTITASEIRGGNVTNSAVLTVSSALSISNTLTVNSNFIVNGTSNTRSINANGNIVVSNTLSVSGNSAISGDLTVSGNNGISTPRISMGDFVTVYTANLNLGSNTTSPQVFYSFPKSEFSSGKILLQSKFGVNTQIYEAVFSHNGGNPSISVYGVVSAPASSNNGLLSGTSNTTHILLTYRQSSQNTQLKATLSLIR